MYRFRRWHIALCALVFASASHFSMAATLCVNPAGSKNCYKTIQDAVNHASANDLIEVGAGTYTEEVTVGIPVSIVGAERMHRSSMLPISPTAFLSMDTIIPG